MNPSTKKTITIVGAGNMGSSLAKGLLANNWNANQIILCEQDHQRHNLLRTEFPQSKIVANYAEAIRQSSIIILAVKPQDMRTVCQQISACKLTSDVVFISIAAGVPTHALQNWLGDHAIIIRCMPNTPAAIGHGITGLYTNSGTDMLSKRSAEEILRCAGKTIWVEKESMLDAVTALSGSGPAYLFYFMECLQESGQALGLSAQDCYTLTLQTMAGAAQLAREQNKGFDELRANVTSKGGTTEQAINCFVKHEFKKIIEEAVRAAADRATEISNSFRKE